jgi:hypothetical protein
LTIFVGVSLIFSLDELLFSSSSKLKTRFFDRFVGGANGRESSSESDDGDLIGSLFSTLIGRSFFVKNELN